MTKDELLKRLKDLSKQQQYASLFFEELSLMRHSKSSIDIERRRMSVNARHNLKLNREIGNEFFRELERLGLGVLTIIRHRGDGNSHFNWTYGETAVDLSKLVFQTPLYLKPIPIRRDSGKNETIILRLASGQILKLSLEDLNEIVHFSREIL